MKNLILLLSIVVISSCQIAELSVVSRKEIPPATEYVLLKKNVEAKAFRLNDALDKCIDSESGGVFLKNIKIYEGFFQYKVKADIWGVKND